MRYSQQFFTSFLVKNFLENSKPLHFLSFSLIMTAGRKWFPRTGTFHLPAATLFPQPNYTRFYAKFHCFARFLGKWFEEYGIDAATSLEIGGALGLLNRAVIVTLKKE